ncbi:para-aminobenzoate synthase component 1 (Para-aminobenzoate synthase component I) (ADC synthase) [Sulfurihydrogenibium azorense Az-Fu1]|uniref:Para-aminobenzoate synthase component 1 (Para-aminobenzoate synthase component I) (ADC synthase) n=2 Tax=Sulfurihydrogenibium azorense TaxID=309806 RepID=C1DUB7_SULAA|nr:para-aminobenzoate synthase component 1 (Para-aminobenzoate synthase component I) (ADC synthase) [Sulfurihydrogenibium azorense Az-Fu1]
MLYNIFMIFLYSNSSDGWLGKQGLFLFNKPVFTLKVYKNRTYLNGRLIKTKKPLKLTESIVKKKKLFAVGFISYDYNDFILSKKSPKKDDTNFPLIYLEFHKNYIEVEKKLKDSFTSKAQKVIFNTTKDDFIKKVNTAKKYIESGDFYQINLSHRIDINGYFNKDTIFFNLINIQPTDYMMLIKNPEFSLISASMELFLEKNGNLIKTKPIKGTVKKTGNPELDEKLKEELKTSQKEKAENLMITDLMRNDLGKIANNIKVDKLFEITQYSTLYQMSSTVSGILKEGLSIDRIIESTFPPGSVTGAPKKRAMEVIEELEDKRRSVYCGATVLIKPNLNFVMSVAIRQILFKKDKAYIYVGSGIVSDSTPEKEWEETLLKAKANLKAIGLESLKV